MCYRSTKKLDFHLNRYWQVIFTNISISGTDVCNLSPKKQLFKIMYKTVVQLNNTLYICVVSCKY